MKAIIITFNGNITNEKEYVKNIAKITKDFTDAANLNTHVLSDKETATILLKNTISDTEIETSEIETLEQFCKKMLEVIGKTSLNDRDIATKRILSFLITHDKDSFVDSVTIISKIDSTDRYKEHRKLLQEYRLEFLPSLLRDVNPLFKFY